MKVIVPGTYPEFSYKGVLDCLRELYFYIMFILIFQETFVQVAPHDYHRIIRESLLLNFQVQTHCF